MSDKQPKRRPALGKGLDALIHSDEPTRRATEASQEIPIDKIDPSIDQPRKSFDDDKLEELADSIRVQGMIQPIVVVARDDRFLLVAGERRYRAAKMAGLSTIPAVVREYDGKRRLLISLVENLQREDLDPIEEASAFRMLLDELRIGQDELARQVGRSRAAVANSLRLLNLSDEIQTALQEGLITAGHGRALLSIVGDEERDRAFRIIISEGLSVRAAEELAERYGGKERQKRPRAKVHTEKKDPEVVQLEEQFITALGTRVHLKGTVTKGTLEISYYSSDDLQRLFDLIVGDEQR